MPKIDRRIRKTKQSLRQALLALLLEKSYEEITVQQILDEADVGRSTFYAHFKDKDDLLMIGMPEQILDFSQADPDSLLPSVVDLFQHGQEGSAWWNKMVGTPVMIKIGQISRQKMAVDWRNRLKFLRENGIRFELPDDVIATHLTGSLMSLIQWWFQNQMPYTPEQMNQMFRQITLQGVTQKEGPNQNAI
ncbi:MAG: TetR/AcrR family transcriptional regulator [Chloroflexota bacterium]